MAMQEIPTDTDSIEYTQCVCCKRWGWEDEDVLKYYAPAAMGLVDNHGKRLFMEFCNECLQSLTPAQDETLGSLETDELTPELWNAFKGLITNTEAERKKPDAIIPIVLKLTNADLEEVRRTLAERLKGLETSAADWALKQAAAVKRALDQLV